MNWPKIIWRVIITGLLLAAVVAAMAFFLARGYHRANEAPTVPTLSETLDHEIELIEDTFARNEQTLNRCLETGEECLDFAGKKVAELEHCNAALYNARVGLSKYDKRLKACNARIKKVLRK